MFHELEAAGVVASQPTYPCLLAMVSIVQRENAIDPAARRISSPSHIFELSATSGDKEHVRGITTSRTVVRTVNTRVGQNNSYRDASRRYRHTTLAENIAPIWALRPISYGAYTSGQSDTYDI